MRKSVERRKNDIAVAAPDKRRATIRRRRTTAIIIAAIIIIDSSFLTFAEASTNKQIAIKQATHEEQMKATTDASKKAVAEIKRKAAEEAAAKAEAEKKAAEERAKQQANPAGSPSSLHCDVTNPESITVVVNKKHCFNPITWAPSDLTSIDGFLMRAVAASHMTDMRQAAAASGAGFGLTSTYRSYANQQVTYANWVQVNGSQAAADTVSARPGFSEHQTGLVADLKTDGCVLECFAGTQAYTWLTEHAAEYGFIQRYPVGLTSITGYSPEAWHWRYVESSVALDMKTKNIETLEAYFGITGGDYSN